ncbi:MAG: GHMP kinase [SAR202 cluster bacterium]|uniref:Threonine kinase in B12 biosynthesis n=1 Tax=hydrothermal vent metagenome TaxID=652676 RepID=A0A160VG75_9ZZZZ|nr:GHMP kinase [SAR202 cluster bacterium]MQG62442.1 GHMP kinase [SAR202 cluster bacterium]MQG71600.1 GHMP kinase [SAR202 cluster bacterium]
MASSTDKSPEEGEEVTRLLGSATVRAPGVCGELAQGVIEGIHFLVTCPVDFYSRVKVDIYSDGPGVEAPQDCDKAAAAVRRTLFHLKNAKVRAKLTINNPIPRGKGMASSSADLAAAIAATGLALGEEISPYQIAQIALSIEPTDGIMIPGVALFDHRAGIIRESLGPPPPMEIVALDLGGTVDTVQFNMVDRFQRWQSVDEQTGEALRLLRRGIEEQDPALVGRGASISAEASQTVLAKPRLAEVKEFAESVGAVGVNVGHSGTIMGVLLDARERRGKSTYHKALSAFPDAESVYHFRLLGGGVQRVDA